MLTSTLTQAASTNRERIRERTVQSSAELIPVVMTVDTEPDDAWTNHQNPSVANVQQLARLQELLDRFGARATLLVTHRVIQDDASARLLDRLATDHGAEIGAHLHPWENPPFLPSGLDVRHATYPHELPISAFEDKLSDLTESISRRIAKPTSYRAGRWGLSVEHLPVLERLGYEVDTSVIPLMDLRTTFGIPAGEGGRGGPDYRCATTRAYRPSYRDMTCPGEARIVELPVTVGFTRSVPLLIRRRYGRFPLFAQRVLRRSSLLRPVWCNPARHQDDWLRKMMQVALAQPVSHLNMAFHSSELALGGSPRTRTPDEVEAVFRRIAIVLELAAKSGRCEFHTLSSAARRFMNGHGAAAACGVTR